MASIADLFVSLVLDDARFQADVVGAANKGSKTLGERLSQGTARGAKGVATAVGGLVAGAFALATRGALQLEDITADLRAETGATAEEADRAAKAINRMAGRNVGIGLDAIAKASIAVRKNLGLVGDEADDTTERFVRFARATKQDAAEAVKDFDDILDAWGLEAKDSGRIMDLLVASAQKYGGSVSANQKALAAMAPQLRALNLGLEDGVGLLNLFATKGIDAAAAQKALNQAVQNLPPGTSLNDFIAELSTIPDQGERARRAVEIFGSKAGVALANALGPGITSLDQFKLNQQQVAGASERAREALDSTFGSRMQLLINGFTSKLRELGSEFGPVLTGAASLATIAGTLGFNIPGAARAVAGFAKDLAGLVGPSLVKVLKNAGQAGGEAIADGLQSVWQGAAGTVIGNNIASRVENIFDPTKPTIIGRVLRAVGAKAGVVYAAAFALAAKLGELAAGMLLGLGVDIRAISASDTAGKLLGTRFGTAFVAGATVGVLLLLPELLKRVNEAVLGANAKLFSPERYTGPVQRTINGVGRILAKDVPDAIRGAEGPTRKASGEWADAYRKPLLAAMATVKMRNRITLSDMVQAFEGAIGRFDQAASALADAAYDPILTKLQIAQTRAELGSAELREALRSKDPDIRRDAQIRQAQLEKDLFTLRAHMAAIGGQAAKDAFGNAKLVGDTWQHQLSSANPRIRAAAWEMLRGKAEVESAQREASRTDAQRAAIAYADGLESKRFVVNRSATRFVADARAPMVDLKSDARSYGSGTGSAWASGLQSALDSYIRRVKNSVNNYRGLFKADSPPGPESPLHQIDVWGERTGQAFGGGMASGLLGSLEMVRRSLSAYALSLPSASADLGSVGAGRMTAVASGVAQAASAATSPALVGTLIVNNPTPEPASTSVRRELRKVSVGLGAAG